MNSNEILDLVKQAYKFFGEGNIPAFVELLSDDVEWITPGANNVPFAGARKGKEAVFAFFGDVSATTRINRFEPVEFFADGPRVVAIGVIEAETLSTGKKYAHKFFHSWILNGGKVASHYNFLNTYEVAESFKK